MLPSLLARDIQTGLRQFLISAYEPSDDFFHGIVRRFAAEAGERIQASVPFKLATIPHPSPANPAANKDWAGAATKAMVEQGVWSF